MSDLSPLKVAIIGCGLIGQKRAANLGNGCLVACADIDINKANLLAEKYSARSYNNWQDLLNDQSIDVVIVATLHDSLASIALAAIETGKNVLIEKPAARNSQELQPLINASIEKNVKVRVGFNHRYHRALQKAKTIIDSGALGAMMFIRARYGHGGRLNYNKEWRANPQLSGGGELIDQGPHLIDLASWFLGEFKHISGFAHTFYWDMPVDDNAFLLLKTADMRTAFMHVSCTEWKNTFAMEIYGKQGKLEINGLGGSYGTEKLTHYHMLPEMGPPETTSWEYPMQDNSWQIELEEFYKDIQLNREPAAGLYAAKSVLEIIENITRMSGYDYSP